MVLRTALRSHAERLSRAPLGLVPLTLGQLDPFHPYLAAARDVLGLRLAPWRLTRLDSFLAIARSAGPWFALPDVVFVSERPLVCKVDPEGRLHAEHGPALAYGDGVRVYAWHGVRVPSRVIRSPESIESRPDPGGAQCRGPARDDRALRHRAVRPGARLDAHARGRDRPAVAALDHAAASFRRRGRGGPDGGGATTPRPSPTAPARRTSCASRPRSRPPARPSPGRSTSPRRTYRPVVET